LGGSNYGGYSNPAFDKLIYEAVATMDDNKRSELLQQAQTEVMKDYAFIPLHFEAGIWAHKANVAYTGRSDQFTLAMSAKPAK
jgi:peptide/nickel transport system substrate-binding protein